MTRETAESAAAVVAGHVAIFAVSIAQAGTLLFLCADKLLMLMLSIDHCVWIDVQLS